MPDIDFALAYSFVDPADGVPRQLRFQLSTADTTAPHGAGQLVAVVANGRRRDNGQTLPISRPDVSFTDIENALDGWETTAMVGHHHVNLAHIQRRIHAAGLD